jgi:hypothetical protein
MEPHGLHPEPFSLAKTFPPFRSSHRNRGPRPNRPHRFTIVARVLAKCGAMTPEGCSARLLHHMLDNHRLTPEDIKHVLGILWNARLLGWHPMDTEWLTFGRVQEIVERGIRRPHDALDMIPGGFKRQVGNRPGIDAYRFAPD